MALEVRAHLPGVSWMRQGQIDAEATKFMLALTDDVATEPADMQRQGAAATMATLPTLDHVSQLSGEPQQLAQWRPQMMSCASAAARTANQSLSSVFFDQLRAQVLGLWWHCFTAVCVTPSQRTHSMSIKSDWHVSSAGMIFCFYQKLFLPATPLATSPHSAPRAGMGKHAGRLIGRIRKFKTTA